MKALLLAGLGPYFKQSTDLVGTLFDSSANAASELGLRLEDLTFQSPDGRVHPLLRKQRNGSLSLTTGQANPERAPIPNLGAATLSSILSCSGIEHEYLPLDAVWDGDREPSSGSFDCILISTTFICDRYSFARAASWVKARFPGVPIVAGGQFTNLKYELILRDHPEVLAVIRGDGEAALPALMRALERGASLESVPNIVLRNPAGGVHAGPLEYVDIESHPAPTFPAHSPIVPYESMRGCPFSCKFCSFPSASPKWRYKSAQRIVSDWANYCQVNEATHIRALDSTFTVPPSRLRELFALLPSCGIGWEAFTRANVLSSPAVIESLARANCRTLSIGFESMSDNSLSYMDKRVSAKQNRTAFQLLRGSPVGYRMSFITGYPGETPRDFAETRNFLVDEFEGHFQLSVFSLADETMPAWNDSERFQIHVAHPENPDYSWTHIGMDVETARGLRKNALRDVRWKNDKAVPFIWQPEYQTPLLPHHSPAVNYRLEKLVERLAFLPVDFDSPEYRIERARTLLDELSGFGVEGIPGRPVPPAQLSSLRAS